MKNQARNYEALQEIASSFQHKALMMLSLQGQPVLLAYFHLLKLMLVFVNGLISYSIIGVFEHQLVIGYVGFIFIITALLGLQVRHNLTFVTIYITWHNDNMMIT